MPINKFSSHDSFDLDIHNFSNSKSVPKGRAWQGSSHSFQSISCTCFMTRNNIVQPDQSHYCYRKNEKKSRPAIIKGRRSSSFTIAHCTILTRKKNQICSKIQGWVRLVSLGSQFDPIGVTSSYFGANWIQKHPSWVKMGILRVRTMKKNFRCSTA